MDIPAELIFTGSAPNADRQVRRRAAAGELRRLHRGIYTANLTEPLEVIGLRHGFRIAAHLFPGAVLSGRTAREMQPVRAVGSDGARTGPGFVFLCHANARRKFSLPGLEIRVIQGAGPQPGDFPLLGLYAPSVARALLDNLTPSRSTAGVSRTCGQKGVEEWLDRLGDQEGEQHLNRIRDQARTLAPQLGLNAEFAVLDRVIGALLGTRDARLESAAGRARGKGLAYDEAAVNRYTLLAAALRATALPETHRESESADGRIAASFIEAYFSNYIEGTRFLIEEARHIVFDGEVPPQRPQDGHDVLATYRQLINLGARAPSAVDGDEFEDEIRARHADLMASRPENDPGRYKQQPNAAGSTVFVSPGRVRGTLRAGLDIMGGLDHPFARAVFVHFLVADVHPFVDGNGRISRIMMTKELLAAGLSRITVPTVWRDDYLGALRALNRHNDPAPIVRAFSFAQRVTAACAAATTDEAISAWASTYAFVEAGAHARLTLPRADVRIEWRNGIPAPAQYWSPGAAAAGVPDGFLRG